jgi:hypothetical protein
MPLELVTSSMQTVISGNIKEGGLDLERFYRGTLNVSITPAAYEMIKPAYTFRQVA